MTDAVPHAAGLPLIGGTLHYIQDPLRYLERSVQQGDIVQVRFAQIRAYIVSNPTFVDQILVKSAGSMQKDIFLRGLKELLGEGLLTSEGDFWKRQRRLIQPAFHREHIAGYAEIMVRRTEEMLARWHDGQVLDVHHELMVLTAQIVTECLFGTSVGDAAEVAEHLESVMERYASPAFFLAPKLVARLPTAANRRFARAAERLDQIVRGFITERRRLGERAPKRDLLAMLLAARDEDGSQMSDQQIRDEVLILFLAGHETTALALSWTLYELAKSARVADKMDAEIDRVLGARAPAFEDVPKLPYIANVVTEGLRMHPPAWSVGRESLAPIDLGDRHFDAGTWLWILPYTLQRDPRFYESPQVFWPERWEDGLAKRLPKFAFMPFGGGPRVCIGNQFALMEAALVLATIGRKFRLENVEGHPVVAEPSITLRFKHGLRMHLRGRRENTS